MRNSIPKAAEHAPAMVKSMSRITARHSAPGATEFGNWSA